MTEQDRKTIKFEKRIAYVFSGLVLMLGAFLNLCFIVLPEEPDLTILFLLNTGIIALSFLVAYSMNRKYNADLEDGTKFIKKEQIQSKMIDEDYGTGGGTVTISGLSVSFPRLWTHTVRAFPKYYLIIRGYQYDVGKQLYDTIEKGDMVAMYYSRYSETLLEIKKLEKHCTVSSSLA